MRQAMRVVVLAALVAHAAAQGTVLAAWDFNAGSTASNAASSGVLRSLAVHRADVGLTVSYTTKSSISSPPSFGAYALSIAAFGTTTNATRGSAFCIASTAGWVPSGVSMQFHHASTASGWSLAGFFPTNASTAFTPLVGLGNITWLISQNSAWVPLYYDLGPTVAANPTIADSTSGFCFGMRAIYAPGTSAYTGSGGTFSSTGGNWYFDDVTIYGVPMSPTPTLSTGASPSPTATATTTATSSNTASSTPSFSPTCPPMTAISGSAGVVTGTLPTAGTVGAFGGSCATGSTVNAYPKSVFRWTPDAGARLGGTLTFTTCHPSTSGVDTMMHLGGGCAASVFNFACLVGNDDATTGTCLMNSRASTISITGANRSEYVVMVANYYAVGSGSYGSGNFGLNWTYVEPTPTPTPTGSASSTATGSPSQTPSRTASATFGASTSSTNTGTPSPSQTASTTGTATGTATPSQTPSSSIVCPAPGAVLAVTASGSLVTWTDGAIPAIGATTVGTFSYTCTIGSSSDGYPKQLVRLELDPSLRLGGTLTVSTCNPVTAASAAKDTKLYLGAGCPVTAAAFGCVVGNDDSSACTMDTSASTVTATAGQYVYHVAVGGYLGAAGPYGLNVTYVEPSFTPTSTATPSTTQTATGTASNTATATLSTGASPSPTATPTVTQTQTGSPSQTPSTTATSTSTPSGTASPSGTPSCPPFATSLVGNSGSYVGAVPSTGSIATYSGSCAGGDYSMSSYIKQPLQITLDAGARLGGRLVVHTCSNVTGTGDTILFIGTGSCPYSAATFGCLFGNDQYSTGSGGPTCSFSNNPSYAYVTATQRTYTVLVGRYASNSGLPYGLTYTYTEPTNTPTGTPSASPTSTGTASGTPSPSQTGTGSSSRTGTPSETPSGTGSPSLSPSGTHTGSSSRTGSGSTSATGTASPSGTASHTGAGSPGGSPTMTATSSGTGSGSASRTGSMTPTTSGTASVTPSGSVTPPGTASPSGTGSGSGSPSRTASASGTRTPSSSQSGTGSGSRTGTPSASTTPSGTATPTPSRTGTPSSSTTGTGTPTSSGTRTGTPSSSQTGSITASSSVTRSGTGSPSQTGSSTRTASVTGSNTATQSGTPSNTASQTASITASGTPTRSGTGTPTPTGSSTASVSVTPPPTRTGTGSVSATPSATPPVTPAPSETPTQTRTPTQSRTGSETASVSATATETPSSSATPSGTASPSVTPSASESGTMTAKPSGTPTRTPSASETASPSQTPSGSGTPSASATAPPTGSMTPTMTATSSGTNTGSSSQTETPSSSNTASPSESESATPTKTRSPTRSRSAAATGTRTGTGSPSGTRTGTGSPSPSGSTSESGSPSATGSPSRSRTASRSRPQSPSRTPSRTPTATRTRSATPTRSPVLPAWSDMVAVLRVGDDAASARTAPAGLALPLYVDYYSLRPAVATPVLSVPLPREPTSSSGACTLAMGKDVANRWNFATEGFPSNSADGVFGLVPCYNVPAGQDLAGDSPKTFATVDAKQTVSTAYRGYISSIVREEPSAAEGWRALASPNGRRFYTASVALYGAGFQLVSDGVQTDADGVVVTRTLFPGSDESITAGVLDARSVALYGGKLYGLCGPADGVGWNTLFQIGGNTAPTAPTNTFVRLPGLSALGQAWAFVFHNASAVWVSAERGAVKGAVQLWRKGATTFSPVLLVTFSSALPVYSLAGRDEFGRFVLYGTDGAKLYRYDTAGAAARVTAPVTLATASSVSSLRGVFFPGRPATTPSPSASPSRASRTATATKTPTRTATRSRSLKKLLRN